jgi:hypothetical protein
MPALIVYLLKVNAALCLFYIAYRFALRPLTFYHLNRFFLVFGIIFSTCYPFIDISKLFIRHEAISRQLNTIAPNWHAVLPAVQQQVETFNYWQALVMLFWIGALLIVLRLAVQFVSLYRIHKSSEPKHYWGRNFRAVQSDVNPFSFWQDIYLNPDKHTDAELRAIIQHEEVHIRQWHTLDVLLAELSIVFYWFNPGIWFMKQAIKENLEFITDREILRSGIDEKVYQYSLVRVSALKPGATIVNNFNFLTIKKRIIMMNKKRSSNAQLTKYIVLPLVILLALIFTVSKAEITNKNISVFVLKMLPARMINAITPSKVNNDQMVVVAPVTQPADTTKSSTKIKDTATTFTGYRLAYLISDSTVNAKAINLKGVKMVRIKLNSNDNKPVIIVDDKNQPVNVSVSSVESADIDSLPVLKGTKGAIVVKLKPTISLSTTSYSTSTLAATDNGLSTNRNLIISDDSDDEIVYIVDPQHFDANDAENMRKTFEKNGFELNLHEEHKGNKLKTIAISLSSDSTDAAASATFLVDDLKSYGYIIKITADKTTGAVSIMSHKK